MPQIEKPDDLQLFVNHPVFCVCMTIACYDGNKKKVCFHFHVSKRPKSGTSRGRKSDFCLPDYSNPGRATPKVEQNPPKSEKCSTRLPSPKQCGLRLRANLRNSRFARKQVLTHWLSRRTSKRPRQIDEANIFQNFFKTWRLKSAAKSRIRIRCSNRRHLCCFP